MYKVLDTNILLLDANNLINLGKDGSVIVLPETVLDEIDSKKSGHSEIAFQAREFGRLLTRATQEAVETKEDLTITILTLNGVTIHIVASSSYPDFKDTEPNIINDRKIIEIALQYKNTYYPENVTFVSNDVMCRIRGNSLGIEVTDLKQVETTDLNFIQEQVLLDEDFRILHNKPILELNPDHKSYHFNYKFINQLTGQVKLATISNSLVKVIGKTTEDELRRQDINPANAEQLFLSQALQDPTTDIVICEAKAGSGKTAVAVSNGIRLVNLRQYDSLIYVRASVDDLDKAEEIGFLSGNDEKMQVYLHPLEDTLDFIIRSRHKQSKLKGPDFEKFVSEQITELKTRCNIQSMIGLGLRGRTFHNAYVVIDEAQNQTKASLQKMLTRFGKGCKIVVIGSQAQIDNPYITKYTNGLSTLLEACSKTYENVNLHAVSLPKVVRGPIAEFAENLFSSIKG